MPGGTLAPGCSVFQLFLPWGSFGRHMLLASANLLLDFKSGD
jgi:hypothetical protein